MSMSDTEYERVVEELKASKTHRRGSDPAAGLWQINTEIFTDGLVAAARRGGFTATAERAARLAARVQALGRERMTAALADAAHGHTHGVLWRRGLTGEMELLEPSAAALDRCVALLDVEVGLAESGL